MTRQSMGALVDDLERWGYVERPPDPADGRVKIVRSETPRPVENVVIMISAGVQSLTSTASFA